jgi:hypothetical protein
MPLDARHTISHHGTGDCDQLFGFFIQNPRRIDFFGKMIIEFVDVV